MKLYAIRDKETGALADYVQAGKLSKDSWVLDKRFGVIWSNDGGLAFLAKDLSDTLDAKLELVTLRIEPTEPCEWCEPKTIPLFYAECVRANIDDESQLISVNYCPNCGRKIKEQTGGTERKEREMEK